MDITGIAEAKVSRGRKPKGQHPVKRLTAKQVQAASRPGKIADGLGLYLNIKPTGAKSWVMLVTIRGRRREIGLGSIHDVSLAEAREKAREIRKAAREGRDPMAERKQEPVPTFREAAKAKHAQSVADKEWKSESHAAAWLQSLETYIFPTVGDRLVNEVNAGDITNAVLPIWTTKPKTARDVLYRVDVVLAWSAAKGFREPGKLAPVVAAGLSKQPDRQAGAPDTRRRAMPWKEVPTFIQAINADDAALPSIRLALTFLVLTGSRGGEVRNATWDEITTDEDGRPIWHIPATKMKMGRGHTVYLSQAAAAVLDEAGERWGRDGLVFPGRTRKAGAILSENTFRKVLVRLGFGDCDPHGFRSAFRTWGAEHELNKDALELALAHSIGNSVRTAYDRAKLAKIRLDIAEKWAAHVMGGKPTDDNVIAFTKAS